MSNQERYGMDGATAQFIADTTWKTTMEQHQVDLICLSILNGSLLINRGMPKKEHWGSRFDEVEAFYRQMNFYHVAHTMYEGRK